MPSDLKTPLPSPPSPHSTLGPILRSHEMRLDKDKEREPWQS